MLKYTVALYYGIINTTTLWADTDALEKTGQIENTIIVYATDHGDMCGAHRLIDKHYNMYDDITHIPMAFAGTGI